MKKVLLVAVAMLLASTLSAQTLWEEGFSSGIPSSWTMFQDNNTAHNSNFTAPWTAVSSYGNPAPGVVSASWFDPAGIADRWLITDAFVVPAAGYVFALDAACYEAAYPDGFQVKVSTTNRDSRDAFTTTIINVPAATTDFTEYRGSLDAFVGETIYIAVVQNSNDMNFLICDNFKVYIPADDELKLMSVNVPAYLAMNTDGNVSGEVKNLGNNNLTSFDVTYSVNGGSDVATYTVTGVNVPFGSTCSFVHNVPLNESVQGNYEVVVTVSNPNGVEDPTPNDNTLSATTVVYDASATVARTNILEEFTGADCGYCPAGADRIRQAIAGTNTIWVAHHAGFGSDGLTCAANTAYTFFYNAGGSTYAPAMMVNRFHGDAEEPGPVTNVYAVAGITSYLAEMGAVPCFLTLNIDGLTYNATTRAFGGTVTGHFTSEIYGPNTRLTLMIIEDSNIMAQADYYVSGYSQPNYMHMDACRGTITGTWGDPISVGANGDFTYNVNGTLASNLNAWRCRVVAIVSNYDASDANNCAVMQAATTTNLNAPYVGISEASEVSLNVYPNPATDYITVEAGSTISEINMYNVLGQKVYGNNAVNAETFVLNTNEMPAGMYLVTIRTNNGLASQRISIAR